MRTFRANILLARPPDHDADNNSAHAVDGDPGRPDLSQADTLAAKISDFHIVESARIREARFTDDSARPRKAPKHESQGSPATKLLMQAERDNAPCNRHNAGRLNNVPEENWSDPHGWYQSQREDDSWSSWDWSGHNQWWQRESDTHSRPLHCHSKQHTWQDNSPLSDAEATEFNAGRTCTSETMRAFENIRAPTSRVIHTEYGAHYERLDDHGTEFTEKCRREAARATPIVATWDEGRMKSLIREYAGVPAEVICRINDEADDECRTSLQNYMTNGGPNTGAVSGKDMSRQEAENDIRWRRQTLADRLREMTDSRIKEAQELRRREDFN